MVYFLSCVKLFIVPQTFKETYRKDLQYLTLRINYKFMKGEKIAKRENDSLKEDERKRVKEKAN